MLSYHKRLVDEKGLPPSRLMLEHAALAESLPPVNGTELQKPEVLRQLEHDQSLDISCASSKREEIASFNADMEELQEQEGEEEKEGEISPFISSLSQTLSLWPEDEEHKCPSWREGPCRYLKCLLEREKESREYDAAGYCDDCEENKNDCECDQDQELQSKL